MSGDHEILTPVVKPKRSISMVWAIPLLTLCVGVWLTVKTVNEQGPEITISFHTADGVEAGKTTIKYKNIPIGMVETVRFGEGGKRVILTARLDREAESFLHQDTRFWVVLPRLSIHGASGLGTLVNGSYIEIDPGHGAPQTEFVGLDKAPAVTMEADGVHITLMSERLGSIDVGSPVYYQGIEVGEVLSYELAENQHSVVLHAFVRAPYDDRVHGNSHFWNVSGINLTMGADGVNLRTSSLQSIIYGGISFDSPPSAVGADIDIASQVYTLYDNYDAVIASAEAHKLRFITFFDTSVRGLDVGAPVEFKGIKVGKVTSVKLEYNSDKRDFRIPVVLEIEPRLIFDRGQSGDAVVYQAVESLINRGLRARLQVGSIITGKLFVALDLHPENKARMMADAGSSLPEIPSIPGGFDQVAGSVQNILAKLEKVPTDEIGKELHASLVAMRPFLETLGKQSGSVIEHLDETLAQANATLKSLDKVLDPTSPMQYQLNQMTRDLGDMARSIRAFVDLLERHPNALISGKSQSGETP